MTKLASLCRHPVSVVTAGTTIRAAAVLMREHHVGAVVVVEGTVARPRPVGIVTDRDIVVAIVALDLDADIFLIDDMFDRRIVVARDDLQIREALDVMKTNGVRRLPLVNKAGVLTGIVTLDDLLGELAADLARVSAVLAQEMPSSPAVLRDASKGSGARVPKRKAQSLPGAARPAALKGSVA